MQGIDVSNINKELDLSDTMINYEMIMSAMDNWEQDQILPLAVIVKSGTDTAKIICDVDSLEKNGWDLACINGAFLEEMTGSREVRVASTFVPFSSEDTELALDLLQDALAEDPNDESELAKCVLNMNKRKKLD